VGRDICILRVDDRRIGLQIFKNRSFPVGTFLRYLMAFGVQMAWQKTGKGSATPPMRMPFGKHKGKSLPMIGPWQMMIALWLGRQIWAIYGDQVKSKLQNATHPVAKHVGGLLPDTGSTPAMPAPAAMPTSQAPPGTGSTPSMPRPAPQYGTQQLDPAQNGSGDLPPGSILSGLRKAS
jgi:hypothetical protein